MSYLFWIHIIIEYVYFQAFLEPQSAFESAMFHETDYGFFHDLEQLYSAPAKEDQVQIIGKL